FFDDILISPIIVDTAPPELVSASAIDSLTVEAVFNEGVDSITAKNNANYLLTGLNNPASVTLVSTSKYRLHYNTSLQTSSYTLTVSNVKDLQGNIIGISNSAQFNFIKPYVAKKNDIAINEIFADPGPQVDLPGLEFIELWNTTDKIIHLNNWKYSDPSTSYTFGNDSLQAGEYLIVCAKTDTLEFKRFGRVTGISPWPSLNNSSDIIKLVSDKNITISEISYSDSWYKDAIKKQGGYTLERIDPLSKCEGSFNWIASADIRGGTPGKINSVYQQNYDSLHFKADSLKQTSDTTLKVWFNKPVDQSSLTSDKFILNPASASLKTLLLDADAKQLTLTYQQKFTSGIHFDLTIQSLKDCSGNIISGLNQPMEFITAPPPSVRLDTATIYITEVFPDPSPEIGLPLAEFVEIYNPGNDTIDLDGWTVRDATTTTTIGKNSILSKQYVILCPAADTTQYKSFGKVIGLSPWPSFTNTSDQVILKSFKDRTVDSVAYYDTWYKNAQKKSGGWTLERIDPLSQCSGSSAWSASKDTAGGTPGKVNSIYIKDYDLLNFYTDSL
ncbi:MAG TPA: lamin tail domain-containing protein, partial [Sphingobacteriaceae bacterium]